MVHDSGVLMGRKIRRGDGSAQPRIRPYHALTRTLMLTTVREADGTHHEYGAHVDYFGDDEAAIYRDGSQVAVVDLPATYPVPGGRLEIALSIFGLNRAHLVLDDGTTTVMRPARHTGEYWRARFAHRFPTASRLVAATAVVVLLAGVAVTVPQLLELVTSWDVLDGRLGSFTSPVDLPAWANTSLFVGGLVAGTERALTIRHHWLIDADTWVLG